MSRLRDSSSDAHVTGNQSETYAPSRGFECRDGTFVDQISYTTMPADGLAPAPGDAWSRRLYDGGPPPTTTRHSQYNNNLGGEPRGPREQVVTAQSVEKSQLLGRQKSPENAQDAREVSVLETWYMEIVSSILALSCIAAIVIILSLYQGKPLPAWPKLISVNALIAVFTAIFKASLIMPVAEGIGQLKWTWFDRPQRLSDIALFDGASRGPWGSLSLIVQQIPRTDKGYLAGLGALITVAALAIDPFSQAMIEHRTCHTTAASGSARVPRANNYTANRNSAIGKYEWSGDSGVTLPTVGALYKGMIDPQETSSLLKVTCSTGNCDFGGAGDSGLFYFSSLAACQSCQDVTNETVEFRSEAITLDATAGDFFRSWQLPNATRMHHVSANQTGNVLYASPVVDLANETYPIDHFALYRIDILTVTNPECEGGARCRVDSPAVRPLAVRCRFDACVKRYRGQVVNGTYAETEESPGGLRLRCTGARQNAAFARLTDTATMDGRERRCEPTDDWAEDSVRVGLDEEGELSRVYEPGVFPIGRRLRWRSYPRECLWAMDMFTWWGLQSLLGDFFTDRVMHSGTDANMAQVRGSPWLRRMYAGGAASLATVEEVVAGLAGALTAEMRNKPYGENEALARDVPERYKAAAGRAIATETCIFVEWGWLAYPAALVVLQWAFLVLVLGGSGGRRARGRGGWKSSPLALLFHGLDDDLRDKSGGLDTAGRMESAADEIRVQLVPTSKSNGWRFSET